MGGVAVKLHAFLILALSGSERFALGRGKPPLPTGIHRIWPPYLPERGCEQKNACPGGNRTPVVYLIVSHFTGSVITAHNIHVSRNRLWVERFCLRCSKPCSILLFPFICIKYCHFQLSSRLRTRCVLLFTQRTKISLRLTEILQFETAIYCLRCGLRLQQAASTSAKFVTETRPCNV